MSDFSLPQLIAQWLPDFPHGATIKDFQEQFCPAHSEVEVMHGLGQLLRDQVVQCDRSVTPNRYRLVRSPVAGSS